MHGDPADIHAKEHAKQGLEQELQQPQASLPHTHIGGAHGYPEWFRSVELLHYQQGSPDTVVANSRLILCWQHCLKPYHMS
eukprot:4689937-Ditylum_brightwellii.AAC.1